MDDTESAQELDWQWDFKARELVSSRLGALHLLVFPSPPRKNRQTCLAIGRAPSQSETSTPCFERQSPLAKSPAQAEGGGDPDLCKDPMSLDTVVVWTASFTPS